MQNILIKNCKKCGKDFEKKIDCSLSNWIFQKYCSKSCRSKDRVVSEIQKQHLRDILKGRRCNTGRTHIKKGQNLSPKTQFKKGHKPWNFEKKNPYFTGPNNPRWKGGIYPEHLKQRHSVEMKRWRMEVFKRDNYSCVECGRFRKKGDRVVLHADHIKPFSKYPNLRFDLDNGRTLCKECHLKTNTHGVNLN